MENFAIINKRTRYGLFFIIVLLLPIGIGGVHLFDWDEVNFAEISREMIITNDFLHTKINFHSFWEKPPLFFWLQIGCMKIFGMNEFGSRFPNVVVGVLTLIVIYHIGKKLFSKDFGVIWVLAYFGSLLPHFYFKTGIIDPLFNLLIFSGLYFFIFYQQGFSFRFLVLSSLTIGLAILTKGPVAALVSMLCVGGFWIYRRQKIVASFWHFVVAVMIICGVASIWFIAEIVNGGGWDLLSKFIAYQIRLFSTSEAGHGQPFYYHFVVLFVGCFPISLIAFPYILKFKHEPNKNKDFYMMMYILFWVVLILFSITTTKIVHYSSLCYFPLSFIATYWIYKDIREQKFLNRTQYWLIAIMGLLLGVVFVALPFLILFKSTLVVYIKDAFAVGNILYSVKHHFIEFIVGFVFIITFLWVLYKIRRGVRFVLFLFVLNIITLNVLLLVFVPVIEQHVQGSLIKFLKHHNTTNEYVLTYGFKSYAQYFYTNKQPLSSEKEYDENWLLGDEVKKPVFIVAKIFDKNKVLEIKNTTLLYEAGGFCFFEHRGKP